METITDIYHRIILVEDNLSAIKKAFELLQKAQSKHVDLQIRMTHPSFCQCTGCLFVTRTQLEHEIEISNKTIQRIENYIINKAKIL